MASTWFPSFSLPGLPSSVQKRFISFVLKRSLGHLVKPGQFDEQNIDAQIGNGFVEIKDIELDSNAVNALLESLPVEFVSGSVAVVSARIPWPNPFSSSIGLSLTKLRINLRASELSSEKDSRLHEDLAKSVANVAEEFMHDELSAKEASELRETVLLDEEYSDRLPGALDTSVNMPESNAAAADVEGVSLFAGLAENLLARFEFTASDIEVTLIDPSLSEFTFRVADISYSGEAVSNKGRTTEGTESAGTSLPSRSLQISGLALLHKDGLRPSDPPRPCPTSDESLSHRSQSSDSEMDEETEMAMSQSLASLPPRPFGASLRPASPSLSTISSAASSLYESAIGEPVSSHEPVSNVALSEEEDTPEEDTPKSEQLEKTAQETPSQSESYVAGPALTESREELLLQFIDTISVNWSKGALPVPGPTADARDDEDVLVRPQKIEKLDLSTGIIAIAARTRHIRSLLALLDTFSRKDDTQLSEPRKSADGKAPLDALDISVHAKGVVMLLLRNSEDGDNDVEAIRHFFDRPLHPPSIAGGYIRVHLDGIEARKAPVGYVTPVLTRRSSVGSISSEASAVENEPQMSCSVTDMSILVFRSLQNPSAKAASNLCSPILVTDAGLRHSYDFRHKHPSNDEEKRTPLPSFGIIDWTLEQNQRHGASLRHWKQRPDHYTHGRRFSSGKAASVASTIGLATSPPRNMPSPFPVREQRSEPALSLSMSISRQGDRRLLTRTGQLHFFLDLGFAKTVTGLLEELSSVADRDIPTEVPSPASSLLLKQQRAHMKKSKTHDSLAQQVLDDLDLSISYLQSPGGEQENKVPEESGVRNSKPFSIDVLIPYLRFEARVPPPRHKAPRSGSFVIDIHDARFSNNGPRNGATSDRPHFDDPELREWFSSYPEDGPLVFEMRRVCCAYAGFRQDKARSFLSLGTISDEESQKSIVPLVVFRSASDSEGRGALSAQKSLLVRIPSFHVALDKPTLDGLQLWVDDISQWAERLGGGKPSGASTRDVSRTTSMLGSRYFTQRAGSGSSENTTAFASSSTTHGSEFIVKAVFSEAFVRLNLRPSRNNGLRIFDVSASALDLLLEVKPERRDEMVVTLGISELCVSKGLTTTSVERTPIVSRRADLGESKQASVRLAFRSLSVPTTIAKESKIKVNLYGLSILVESGPEWIEDLLLFAKSPPGAFETVVPNERTHVSASLAECILHLNPPSKASSMLVSLDDVIVSTVLTGDSSEKNIDGTVGGLAIFLADKLATLPDTLPLDIKGAKRWLTLGYAQLASIQNLHLQFLQDSILGFEQSKVNIDSMLLNAYLCADTISGIASFASDLQSLLPPKPPKDAGLINERPRKGPTPVGFVPGAQSTLLRSIDEQAFLRQPVVGPMPDLIGDDLPSNPDYLDSSFSAAAGLRVLDDDDDETYAVEETAFGGGETIKILQTPLEIVENYYDNVIPSSLDFASEHGNSSFKVRAKECDVHLFFHDGYDWEKTRKDIQDEVKRVKKRLAKIRQLLASGQSYDPNIDELNSVLFNSVYVGLDADAESLEPDALMAAIDLELKDDEDAASESSWQSFKPNRRRRSEGKAPSIHSMKLERAKSPSIEIALKGFALDFDQYAPDAKLISRLLFTIHNLRILDHMKSSTWSTFLTELRADPRGNIRESDSNMVRVELQMLVPFQGQTDQEARLKAKLLPLRLHVDQDALDFLKKFFAFKVADAQPSPPPENEIFFQHVEIFPVDIKLDYKPRRVDYRALKEGRTIELMNFFHFDGAEMTLRHITLKGITGWPRMFDTLNDLWTPDVKANQLVDVISGVSPIRSAVNVGSGVADLILLPIAQYKKDGRIIRGLQKGTTSFVKSTAMEAIRLGARLATGTQVVLEQAETLLGGQISGDMTVDTPGVSGETLNVIAADDEDVFNDDHDLISRYAEQPPNVREGVQDAYKTLSQNIKSAGQTILAVPMEVYERSGNEGPARAVIRAVPIAVLKPMIGASEAISKTLFGLHNTLDPLSQLDYEAKYKHR